MQEILDYAPIAQPDIMYDFMGFAHPPDYVTPLQEPGRLNSLWSPVVWGLADAHGLAARPRRRHAREVDRAGVVRDRVGTAPGRARSAGCGSGSSASKDGEERIVLEHITRMGEHSAPDWPRHPSPLGGYRVILEGMPTYTVDIEMHGRGSNMRGLSFATFMRPLNAVPAVVAAAPGIVSSHDLPLVAGVMTGAEWTGVIAVSGVTDDLDGKVVVVTGASKGVGRGIARVPRGARREARGVGTRAPKGSRRCRPSSTTSERPTSSRTADAADRGANFALVGAASRRSARSTASWPTR